MIQCIVDQEQITLSGPTGYWGKFKDGDRETSFHSIIEIFKE